MMRSVWGQRYPNNLPRHDQPALTSDTPARPRPESDTSCHLQKDRERKLRKEDREGTQTPANHASSKDVTDIAQNETQYMQ